MSKSIAKNDQEAIPYMLPDMGRMIVAASSFLSRYVENPR
jgi:hypothetical protein